MRQLKKCLLFIVDFVDHNASRCPKSALFIAAGLLGGIVLTVMAQMIFAPKHNEPSAVKISEKLSATVEREQQITMPEPPPNPFGAPMAHPVTASPPPQYIIQPGTVGDATVVRRAVDYEGLSNIAPGQVIVPRVIRSDSHPVILQVQPAQVQQYSQVEYVQPVGRNGLLSNPCVDPPSSRGAAYGRGQ